MLKDYRDWLDSELKLLGNANHDPRAFGQVTMAKRALERFDDELARTLYVPFDRAAARRALTALEAVAERATTLAPELEALRDTLRAALQEAGESSAL